MVALMGARDMLDESSRPRTVRRAHRLWA